MQSNKFTEDGAEPLTLKSAEEILSSLEENIDVASWINERLGPGQPGPSTTNDQSSELIELDRRVSNLVGTLELASEDTSAQVERIIDDISRGASRLTYDLHFMREGALSLQALLQNLEVKSKVSVDTDTSAALDRLHFLDSVKRNMEATREVLREAESWSTLESDVTSLLGEQNYTRAAERLSEASKSMVVFQNTPEYESRRTLMTSLQNQLEASLSSALVAAVNSQDVVVCRNYFSIFSNIQRESEFRNYYYGSRRASLTEAWQKALLLDCDSASGTPTQTFSQFLPTFYASLVSMLQAERTSIPAIFPDPQSTLSTLITSTLSALQPTFPQRLASFATHYGSTALAELIPVYKTTEGFAVLVDKIFEKIGFSTPLSPSMPESDGNAQQRSHLRRRSSARMSMSRRNRLSISGKPPLGIEAALALDWPQELFEPFVDFQVDYGSLEQRYLADTLRSIMNTDERLNVDRSRLLRERLVDVFSIAEDAMARCAAFTHGYGSVGLVKALDRLFASFADMSKAEISSRRTSSGMLNSTSGEGLSDLDYTPEDWSNIQSLLHLLEAVRALLDRMTAFEGKLRTNLIHVSATFRAARRDPVGYEYPGTTKAAVQVLAQSSLNSAELHELLNQVDPDSSSQQPPSRAEAFLSPTPHDSRRVSTRGAQIPLLLEAREAISNFAKACQVALQDTILGPLRKHLAPYASSLLWSAQTDQKSKRGGVGGSALSEVHVPTFSLSPSEVMQRLAEGLLNLPRLFEVYADDDALSFSLETLPFINVELLQSLSERPVDTPSPANPHSRRSPSLSLKVPPAALQSVTPELTPEAVSAAWLSSLGLSLLSHLTSDVLPSIRTLSASGAAQLASDLGYLSSIVMALNVECEDLDKWKEYAELDDVAGRQKVKDSVKVDSILNTVARLRGWTV